MRTKAIATVLLIGSTLFGASLGHTQVYPYASTKQDVLRAIPVTVPENGEITSISIYHNGGFGLFSLGIYAGQLTPEVHLVSTPELGLNHAAGWQTVHLNAPLEVLAGEKLWLAWAFEFNPGVRYQAGSPGRAEQASWPWYTLPTTGFGAVNVKDYVYSIYCTFEPDGTTPPPPPPACDLTEVINTCLVFLDTIQGRLSRMQQELDAVNAECEELRQRLAQLQQQ